MRTNGYYWCHNNKVYKDADKWRIYYWDGNNFWDDGDDFSEDCFETIDEETIERKEKGIAIGYVDTNPETREKYLPVKICECESPEMANWVSSTLTRDLYEHADDPNREIIFLNCL
jgi:hypothetical protein